MKNESWLLGRVLSKINHVMDNSVNQAKAISLD